VSCEQFLTEHAQAILSFCIRKTLQHTDMYLQPTFLICPKVRTQTPSSSRTQVQEKFAQSFLARECRAAAAAGDEAAQVAAVRDALKAAYATIVQVSRLRIDIIVIVSSVMRAFAMESSSIDTPSCLLQAWICAVWLDSSVAVCETVFVQVQAFTYYSVSVSSLPFFMGLNEWTALLDECGIPDNETAGVKRSDLDTIFIVCTRKVRVACDPAEGKMSSSLCPCKCCGCTCSNIDAHIQAEHLQSHLQ
jgi:hypothetical protein